MIAPLDADAGLFDKSLQAVLRAAAGSLASDIDIDIDIEDVTATPSAAIVRKNLGKVEMAIV
jgi:hypothetical protein